MKNQLQKKNRPDKPTHKLNYKLDYSTSMAILESHKFDLLVSSISQKTHSRPKPYKNGWKLCCPAHDDKISSFVTSQTPDSTILVYCFAGCSTEEICRSINIEVKYLFPLKKWRGRHD